MGDHNGQVMWLARPAGRHRHDVTTSEGRHRNTRWAGARDAGRPDRPDQTPPPEPTATVPNAPAPTATLDAAAVTAALASLDPIHREILAETYFRGRTVGQAASALGLPVETVKARVYAALRALDRAARAA